MFQLISTANYALDAFQEMSTETFLCSMAVKNLILYGYSYFVNDWAVHDGPFKVMWVLNSVAAALLLTFSVSFVFGKRYRAFWATSKLREQFIQPVS